MNKNSLLTESLIRVRVGVAACKQVGVGLMLR